MQGRVRPGQSRHESEEARRIVRRGGGSLLDPLALVREDEDARGEARFVLTGRSGDGRLLTVCYTLRDDDETIRLISARESTRREERQYAQGI